jgi:hypothetical protein
MDIETGLELGKFPLMSQGEADLPSPNAYKAAVIRASAPGFDPEDDDKYLEKIPEWTVKEMAVALVASGSVTTSILALVIAGINPIIYATAIMGIIIPPYSALQEQKITDCKAMKETNLAMEREMANLKYNNDRLAAENDKLENSVGNLQDMKDTYAECQKMGKISIIKLEQQLEESKTALGLMETNRSNEIVDNIFDVMLAVDKDENFQLSDDEIDILITRIEGIMNIEVSDDSLKKKIIENGRDLDSIMLLLRDLLDNDPDTAPEGAGEQTIRVLE